MGPQIKAILFDLDGTLLSNDMRNVFLPQYFRLLSARVAHLIPPDKFMPLLMEATEAMIANDGRDTNEEVFAQAFYPRTGHLREELEPIFLEFYANEFGSLQQYVTPMPASRQVVQMAFDLGFDVAIATNPVFPRTAVQQRLLWAGVADFSYNLVTSYENCRATKPNLRYFAQILETIGHAPESSLVVGDEDMDMVAANIGCQTYLIPGPGTDLAPSTPNPTYQGTLAELMPLMQRWA